MDITERLYMFLGSIVMSNCQLGHNLEVLTEENKKLAVENEELKKKIEELENRSRIVRAARRV